MEPEDLGDFLDSAPEVLAALPTFLHSASAAAVLTFVRKCLYAFLQANCTGPPLHLPPGDRTKLSLDGEDPISELVGVDLVLAASEIARVRHMQNHFDTFEECRLSDLWAARALKVHQHCLLNPVPTLKSAVLQHYDRAVENETDARTRAEICVEAAHCSLYYFRVSHAQKLLAEAQDLAGLRFWLTGKMGYRTKYQHAPTAQLVLETESQGAGGLSVQTPASVSLDFDPDNILHETPVLVEPATASLSVLDQCVLLGVVQHQVKARHADEIQREQIGAYLESTLQQALDWLVYSTSLLYRSRNQFHNYKTK